MVNEVLWFFMPPTAFLFDIGNVLVHFDFKEASRRFAEQSDATPDEVLAVLLPFKNRLESGRISDDDFITQSTARIGFRGSREDFITIWGNIFAQNPPMSKLVERLSHIAPLYLLSNNHGLHKEWLFTHFEIFRHFKGAVFSHEVGCMKPHVAIYRKAIGQFSLQPEQTFFLDDLPDNIATARHLGFICHQYHSESHEDLEAVVSRWLSTISVCE